jgi:3-hydroxyacyl-[acyl-carrier-protein] dehydratase
MLATRNTIDRYIPQRPPFVMVHDLVNADEHHATTQFEILPDNVLVKEGVFTEPGLIENMAQTAAVQAGYNFVQQNLPIPIGYIASVKGLRVFSLPEVGSTLTTSVRIINQVLNVTLAECRVECSGQVVCECELRIFIKND